MRAIVVREFGPPEGMVIEERPAPHPGPDQVRVDVHAIGVNYPDLLVIGGKNRILPPRPFVPGKDAAGVVSAVGKSVRHCQAGILHQASVSPGPISLTFMAVRLDPWYRGIPGRSRTTALRLGLPSPLNRRSRCGSTCPRASGRTRR